MMVTSLFLSDPSVQKCYNIPHNLLIIFICQSTKQYYLHSVTYKISIHIHGITFNFDFVLFSLIKGLKKLNYQKIKFNS